MVNYFLRGVLRLCPAHRGSQEAMLGEKCTVNQTRRQGGEGSGGDVLCDAERGDNEACLSLPHIPPSQHFHAISAICCPDCASSTVPMTNWLAARPLSSGLSL